MSDWETFFFLLFVCALPFWYLVFMSFVGLILIQIEKIHLKMKGEKDGR